MFIKNILFLMLIVVLTSCDFNDSKPHKVQAFVVIGSGGGVPLAGREIRFFDKKLPKRLLSIYKSYNDQLNKDLATEIEVNSDLAEALKKFDKKTHNKELEIDALKKQHSLPLEERIGNIEEVRNEKKRKLKSDQEILNVALKEYNESASDLSASLSKKIKRRNELESTNNRLRSEIEKIVNQYIIDNKLDVKQSDLSPSSATYLFNDFAEPSKCTIKGYEPYDYEVRFVTNSYTDCLRVRGINSKLMGKVDSIDIKIITIHKKTSELKSLENAINKLKISIDNALTSWKEKHKYIYNSVLRMREEGKDALYSDLITKKISKLEEKISYIDSDAFMDEYVSNIDVEYKKTLKLLSDELDDIKKDKEKFIENALRSKQIERDANVTYELLKIFEANTLNLGRLDANGEYLIPKGAKYIYFEASRLQDEHFVWLVEIDNEDDPFLISNHNMTEDQVTLGPWVLTEWLPLHR